MNYQEALDVIKKFAEKEMVRVSFEGETLLPSEHERQMIEKIEKKSCVTVYHIVRSVLPVLANGKLKKNDLTSYLLTADYENLQRMINGMTLEDFIGDNKDVYAFVDDKYLPNFTGFCEIFVEPANETVFIPQHSNCLVVNGSYIKQSNTYIEVKLIMNAEPVLTNDFWFKSNHSI